MRAGAVCGRTKGGSLMTRLHLGHNYNNFISCAARPRPRGVLLGEAQHLLEIKYFHFRWLSFITTVNNRSKYTSRPDGSWETRTCDFQRN